MSDFLIGLLIGIMVGAAIVLYGALISSHDRYPFDKREEIEK